MANGFVAAAAALTIALGVYMSMPHSSAVNSTETYIEALADTHPLDAPDIVASARLDLSGRLADSWLAPNCPHLPPSLALLSGVVLGGFA
jgi:hypothetical protein